MKGTVEEVCENVGSLVGYFRLDPNRALDLCLSAMERDLGNTG